MAKRTCLEPNCPLPVISRRGLCRPHHEAEVTGPDKRCSKCKTKQSKAEFPPVKKAKDGRHSWCKACLRALAKAKYDPLVAAAKHRAKQEDPAYRAMKKAAYDHWRAAHPERAKAATMAWRAANPERPREAVRRYFARKAQATIEKVDYSLILERDGMVCHICKGDIFGPDDLHFDHVVPLSRGGAHSMANIKPSHERCNLSKGAKLMEELNL